MAQIGRLSKYLKVKKIGNWDGAIRFLGKMGYEVKKKSIEAQWEICKKLKRIVVGHLLAQDLNWEPLSRSTKKKDNTNKGLILIDTELYLENIKVWKEAGSVQVGVKKGVVYRTKSGTKTLDQVARYHELGTRREKARPLWAPSIDELGGAAGMKQFVVDKIYNRLKWLSRGTPIQVTKRQIFKNI